MIPEKFFISGTDTDVGKTVAAAVFMAGLPGACYWKPVQSGVSEGSDTEFVRRVTGLAHDRFFPETYRLDAPLSPHAAAALEGVSIELSAFDLPESSGPLVVEGAGGLMAPLNRDALMTDLMKHLGLPVLLVARSGLGTINHTLLSLEQLRREQIPVLGVVMNGPENPSNREAIEHFGRARVVLELPPLEAVNFKTLAREYSKIRWWEK